MAKKVLIVDDDEGVRSTLRTLLDIGGYVVEEAEDGQDALNKLRGQKFHLMIVDLMMPGMDGYELVKRLSPEQIDKTPIVMLTGKNTDADVLKGYSIGAIYYMTKPFKQKRLLDIAEYLTADLTPERREALEARL